jgi:hypothetical protein
VLVGSSVLIALLKRLIPHEVRITAYILIIATFVTLVDLILAAVVPDIHKALGAFIALIVVNCMILGRQEAFSSKRPVGAPRSTRWAPGRLLHRADDAWALPRDARLRLLPRLRAARALLGAVGGDDPAAGWLLHPRLHPARLRLVDGAGHRNGRVRRWPHGVHGPRESAAKEVV